MRHHVPMLVAAAFAVTQSTPTLAASLDGFLANFETCEISDQLQDYVQSVGARFATPCCEPDEVTVNEAAPIALPNAVAETAGQPVVTNHGEYIEAALPLTGDYSGVPVQGLILNLGNENGIFSATLQFAVTRADVLDRFGEAVKAANIAGEAAWGQEGYGFSAIVPDTEPGSITCDWSV